MAERLSLPATRVAEVVAASGASKATVLRYRQTRGDGSPVHGHLPLYEAAITRAIRELPEPAQLQIPSVAGSQPPKRLGGVSPTMGQPGEIRSCPPGLPERCAQLTAEMPPYRPKRCHVTLLVVGPDGSESEVRA